MKGRVNIQYSIDIDSLDSEIERLSSSALDKLSRIAAQKRQISDPLTHDFYERIDELRQQLATVDISLAEINHLVGSYLNYKSEQISTQEDQEMSEPSDVVPNATIGNVDMGELQSKIERFKKAMEAGDSLVNDNADQG